MNALKTTEDLPQKNKCFSESDKMSLFWKPLCIFRRRQEIKEKQLGIRALGLQILGRRRWLLLYMMMQNRYSELFLHCLIQLSTSALFSIAFVDAM